MRYLKGGICLSQTELLYTFPTKFLRAFYCKQCCTHHLFIWPDEACKVSYQGLFEISPLNWKLYDYYTFLYILYYVLTNSKYS